MADKTHILIVDDEPEILTLYGDELKDAGFEVSTAINGAEGLRVAAAEHPDLILLDFKMPIMDGIEMFNKMKEMPELKDVKVIFITAFGDPRAAGIESDIKFAEEMGAAGFIKKGVDLNEVVKKVSEVLSS